MSVPIGRVRYPDEPNQSPLWKGKRVMLFDGEGLEVKATIVPHTTAWGEGVLLVLVPMTAPDSHQLHATTLDRRRDRVLRAPSNETVIRH